MLFVCKSFGQDLTQKSTTPNGVLDYVDGNFSRMANPNHIKENANPKNILLVYPNPSNGIFNLKFNTSKTEPSDIQVFNNLGQLIYQNKTEIVDEFAIDLSSLPSGQYFLKINNANEVYSHKIIKD